MTKAERNPTTQQVVAVSVSGIMVFWLLFYAATHPKQGEQFFALSVLGPNLKAGEYYPSQQGLISIGENVSWFIEVSSFMSSPRSVKLTVAIGGPQQTPATSFSQSDVEVIASYGRVMQPGETWLLPLNWKTISAYANKSGDVSLCVSLNNVVVQPSVTSEHGRNFRIVIALWTIEPYGDTTHLRGWLQVWFTVPNYSPQPIASDRCSSSYGT